MWNRSSYKELDNCNIKLLQFLSNPFLKHKTSFVPLLEPLRKLGRGSMYTCMLLGRFKRWNLKISLFCFSSLPPSLLIKILGVIEKKDKLKHDM